MLRDETVYRIEQAPSGLRYVMTRHGAVFYRDSGSVYILDVPKRTSSGKQDHREYEQWSIEKTKVELMTSNLDSGVPPMRFDAQPLKSMRIRYLKRDSGKRIR